MGKTSGLFGRAVDNFVRSLAGYAIVTYMLQVQSRYNGSGDSGRCSSMRYLLEG